MYFYLDVRGGVEWQEREKGIGPRDKGCPAFGGFRK
jgi:hypothetical protein